MKLCHIAGLAFVPLILAKPLGEREEKNVKVAPLKEAIEFEDLVQQIAINADATLAVEAEQRGFVAPVSLNNIVERVFADQLYSASSVVTFDNEYAIEELPIIEEKEDLAMEPEVAISEEDTAMLNNLHDELLSELGTLVADTITETQNALIDMVDRAALPNIFKLAKALRDIYEVLFKNYGTKKSPIERISLHVESAARNFGKNLKAPEVDPVALAQLEKNELINALRTEIRPVVTEYLTLQPLGKGGLFLAEHVVEKAVGDVMRVIEGAISAVERTVGNVVSRTNPEKVMDGVVRLHLIKTIGQITTSFFELIQEQLHMTHFMMHTLTRAADTYNLLDNHLDQLQKTGMHGFNDGLYVLMNDGVQIQKLTNALIRNAKPLTANAASAIHPFVSHHMDVLQQTSGRALILSPTDLIFHILDKLVEDIHKKHPFIGTILKKILGLVEKVVKDHPEILSRKPSIGNIVTASETVLDTFIETLKTKALLFEN